MISNRSFRSIRQSGVSALRLAVSTPPKWRRPRDRFGSAACNPDASGRSPHRGTTGSVSPQALREDLASVSNRCGAVRAPIASPELPRFSLHVLLAAQLLPVPLFTDPHAFWSSGMLEARHPLRRERSQASWSRSRLGYCCRTQTGRRHHINTHTGHDDIGRNWTR